METTVLKSELAGSWYTDDPINLAREIDTYLAAVDPSPIKDLIALILPHAGYRYSGMTAAHGVRLLKDRPFRRVIILGPSHRTALLDRVSIPDAAQIETPLGTIPLALDAVSSLWKNEQFESHPYVHQGEHSVQIELPFLQRALDEFEIIPIVCGQLTAESAAAVGQALRPLLDDQTLLVVSTDFTHYGSGFDFVPFTENVQHNIRELDMGAFAQLQAKQLDGFLDYVQRTGATICGTSPLLVLLSMMGEESDVRLLKYETSGNLTDDWSHCVSYLAGAVSGHWKKAAPAVGPAPPPTLSTADKTGLLELARAQIASRFGKQLPEPVFEKTAAVHEAMGAFVTLHKHGQLRGCIGEIFPRRALIEAVREHAVNAAFQDPRFPKLREDELREIDIEISALTPPEKVGSYDDIEIGRHGIVLSKDMQSAVFLPQVAGEQGWNLETTLSQLSMKAGLPSDAWKKDCEFHVFKAVVFSER